MSHEQLEFNFDDSSGQDPSLIQTGHTSPFSEILRAARVDDIEPLLIEEWGETPSPEISGWSRPDAKGHQHYMEPRDILFLAVQRANSAKGDTVVAHEVYRRIRARLSGLEASEMRTLVPLANIRTRCNDDGLLDDDAALEFCTAVQDEESPLSRGWVLFAHLIDGSKLDDAKKEEMLSSSLNAIRDGTDLRLVSDVFHAVDTVVSTRYNAWKKQSKKFEDAISDWNQTHASDS
jgi:hypothetical protein